MGIQERAGPDVLPARIVIHDCGMIMDGGTILLGGADEHGRRFGIMLVSPLGGTSTRVAGRLYFDGDLVPIRSEREAAILKLLEAAGVEASPSPTTRGMSRLAVIGSDIKEFLERSPEENCNAFIRQVLDAVRSESYLRMATDEERAYNEESNRDDWERPPTKKKRRPWRRGG